jgi:hypothetical protein
MVLTTEAMPSLLLKVREVHERCSECLVSFLLLSRLVISGRANPSSLVDFFEGTDCIVGFGRSSGSFKSGCAARGGAFFIFSVLSIPHSHLQQCPGQWLALEVHRRDIDGTAIAEVRVTTGRPLSFT